MKFWKEINSKLDKEIKTQKEIINILKGEEK